MKSVQQRLSVLTAAGFLLGGLGLAAQPAASNAYTSPIFVTPPAIHDGSNQSRAPFPAARPFNDVKAPDGYAIDRDVPPNTPATDPEPIPTPPARYAILQPRYNPAAPGLEMTGRASVGLAASLDANQIAPQIRSAPMASRDQLLSDLESRLSTSDSAMRSIESTTREMSPENRAQFKTSADDVKAREKTVRHSIRSARRAHEDNWDAARAQLAADYEAYASAAGNLDAAAGVPPVQR